jgi:hypothetical protein
MNFTTIPTIEYAVFLAVLPHRQWRPRFSIGDGCVVIGSDLSTLYVFRNTDGSALFESYDIDEIRWFAREVERLFPVQVMPL